MTLRELASKLAFEWRNCSLLGCSWWPHPHVDNVWECACGQTSFGKYPETDKWPRKFGEVIANWKGLCLILGHDWLIGFLASGIPEPHWHCAYCSASKPYNRDSVS